MGAEEIRIVISGNTPSKKTGQVVKCRGKRPYIFSDSDHQAWHKAAKWEVASQLNVQEIQTPLQYRAIVRMKFYRKSRHRFDYINMAQSIMDLLAAPPKRKNRKSKEMDGIGLIQDDNTKYVIPEFDPKVEIDKENPRCEIIIRPAPETMPLYSQNERIK